MRQAIKTAGSYAIVHSCLECMLLFPHNSVILDSVVLCLESFYQLQEPVLLVLVLYKLEV